MRQVARVLLNILVCEAIAVQVWLWTLADSRPKWTEHVAPSTEARQSQIVAVFDNTPLQLHSRQVGWSSPAAHQSIALSARVCCSGTWKLRLQTGSETAGYQDIGKLDFMRPPRQFPHPVYLDLLQRLRDAGCYCFLPIETSGLKTPAKAGRWWGRLKLCTRDWRGLHITFANFITTHTDLQVASKAVCEMKK